MAYNIDDGATTLAPGDAFAALGNETRMSILRSLWDSEGPLTFSALQDATGINDPGRFHYHLDQLTTHFVEQSDEGYDLRGAGESVIRAVLAGAITENPKFGPTELESNCPYCGGTAVASYADETFSARCTQCGGLVEGEAFPPGTFMKYKFPPAGIVDRTPDEVLEVAHVLYDAKITAMFEQVCPECAGPVVFNFDICSEHELADRGICETCKTRRMVWLQPVCENCRYSRSFPAWFAIATNPAVVSFYYEHGVQWNRVPFSKLTWENAPYSVNIEEEVPSNDPLEIRFSIPLDNDELRITVDAELNVTQVIR